MQARGWLARKRLPARHRATSHFSIPADVAERWPHTAPLPLIPLSLEGRYLLSLPGHWGGRCLQRAPWLAPAQDAGGPMALGQGQDVVALVAHHLQQSLKWTNTSERRKSSF